MARRIVWTQYLVDEVIEVVPRRRLSKGRGRSEEAVRRQWEAATKQLWRDEVTSDQWQAKMGLVVGPDEDDHPHQAAAMYAQADYLLTHDVKGFPARELQAQGVTVIGVDTFLCLLLQAQPDDVRATVTSRVLAFSNPPMTLETYLGYLSKSAPQFCAALAEPWGTRLPWRARLRARLSRPAAHD